MRGSHPNYKRMSFEQCLMGNQGLSFGELLLWGSPIGASCKAEVMNCCLEVIYNLDLRNRRTLYKMV